VPGDHFSGSFLARTTRTSSSVLSRTYQHITLNHFLASRPLIGIMATQILKTNIAELLACTKCLRHGRKHAEEGGEMPLNVSCTFSKDTSSKCDQCQERRDTGCDTVCSLASR
jgi:hypothetical protein